VVVTEDNQRVDIVPPQDASIQITSSLLELNILTKIIILYILIFMLLVTRQKVERLKVLYAIKDNSI
jgi:hypothetical protein